ncbi:MAG: hypothetical protein PHT99_11215 [Methanoregula sp.]|jgi:FKBP-type peptidyl-prolyl cis-trans isomerase|nr:hypothetical protein [Methanoregula sp.]
MTDNYRIDPGGYQPNFIEEGTGEIAQKKRRTIGVRYGGTLHNRLPGGNVFVFGREK